VAGDVSVEPASARGDAAAHQAAAAIARRSYGKLVAYLAAATRDVAAAEDALSEAFAVALCEWPSKGCPSNPEAWLLTVARRRLIDGARHRRVADAAEDDVRRFVESLDETADDVAIPDERLALLFACAHPAIEESIRAPLMLQTVLGLDADAIASAFLTSPAAMAKRLVRAKQKIREAGIPFRIPERNEMPARRDAVLGAIYAAFAEGWTDPEGADAARRDLAEEATFLARLAAELLPNEPEALGLLALVLYAESRRAARRDSRGEFVPLAEQDPSAWDASLIAEAEVVLRRASALNAIGRYQLEAALQSAHAEGRRSGRANAEAIVALYDALYALTGSPVVALNRALAIAERDGAGAALDAMPNAEHDARLGRYQPYWAARAELLSRAGRCGEAREAYEIAIGLERDEAVRRFLQKRQSALDAS
jgi:RNA polymerase sigma-70 factor (ECF subfamily)